MTPWLRLRCSGVCEEVDGSLISIGARRWRAAGFPQVTLALLTSGRGVCLQLAAFELRHRDGVSGDGGLEDTRDAYKS